METEQNFLKGEGQLRGILDHMVDGVITIDEHGIIEFFNPAAEKMFGYGAAEVIGANVNTLIPEDDREHHDGFIQSYLETGAGKIIGVGPREVTAQRKDGSLFALELAIGEVILDGKRKFIGAARDNTWKNEAERELAEKSALLTASFENMSQGFSVYDADFKLVAFNQNYVELRGFPPGLIRLGMGYDEVIRYHIQSGEYGDGDMEDIVKTCIEGIRQSNDRAHIFQRTTPGGTVLVGRRNPMPGGGFVTTYTDITEFKKIKDALLQSEEHLKAHILELEDTKARYEAQSEDLANLAEDVSVARDEAEEANRAKSEFLALMSHELRTPLNAVIGFSEIIMNEMFGAVGNAKYKEYAHDVHDSGLHLLGLINDILDLSKIEAGGMELDEEEVSATEVINSSLSMIRGRAESGKVTLITEIAENLPNLYIDRRKLLQILVNLLSNAVKFTPEGGKVTIKVWCNADSGYMFQVIDTGIGIALADIPKALSPFGQVDDPLGRKHEGTGLGLPLTKNLVEMNSGSLDLQSIVGKGTIITVRFPAERIMTDNSNSQSAAG